MGCVYFENCYGAQQKWEKQGHDLTKPDSWDQNEVSDFVKSDLCSAGAKDLDTVITTLNGNIENGNIMKRKISEQALPYVDQAKKAAKDKRISDLKKLAENNLVSMGVKFLKTDDKKLFAFVKNMLNKAK